MEGNEKTFTLTLIPPVFVTDTTGVYNGMHELIFLLPGKQQIIDQIYNLLTKLKIKYPNCLFNIFGF